jgi:hypothetical protein
MSKSAPALLQVAIHQLLLKTGARVAWATVRQGAAKSIANSQQELNHLRVQVSSISREYRLKLSDTFDATLSHFGSHTRRNLRYYRRRAEKELRRRRSAPNSLLRRATKPCNS